MITNSHHLQILALLKSLNPKPDCKGFGLKYVGTDKPSYHLMTADQKLLIREFLKNNQLNPADFFDLITSLYEKGETYDEIIIAGRLVGACKFRSQLDPQLLDTWLSYVHGWAEVDTLCQMAFSPDDLLGRWDEWKNLLTKFTLDANVHKRRASLVLLTKPIRQSPDERLSQLAFLNTDRLKSEKDILITKAVSWILRSLIRHHPAEVKEYLDKNHDLLPKIAIREVKTKLLTGRKYVRNTD